MHVGIITHNVVRGDGQGRVSFEIAKFARQQGAEVTLIANRVSPELLELGINWRKIPTSEIANLIKGVEFAVRSSWLIKRERLKFDAILCNGFVYLGHHDINAAHFVHGSWLKSEYYPFRKISSFYSLYQRIFTTLNTRFERYVFNRSRHLVAISEKISEELQSIGQTGKKIQIFENGVDVEEFWPGEQERQPLSLPMSVPLALFVGDIRTPRKNLDTVLRALKECPNLHLAVVGRTTNSPFPAMSEALGLANRVHFLGFRQDLPAIMRASDFFVFPSRYEPAGLVIVEALASGLPVITARTVGFSNLVGDDVGFVLEDPDDVAALTASLITLSNDITKREQLGACARRLALNYTWERMARKYWNLFASVSREYETTDDLAISK